ncbi:MAG: endonuclease III [Sphaerochaetaceae bacterium]|nr:endonuclease III [Sphaerochaetaceae bacterium]
MAKNFIEVSDILDKTSPKEITFLEERNPFQFLICVILSAQTTDERVNMVAPTLFSKYPTPEALAEANVEDVKEIIRTIGFYNNKSKNIIGCAQVIVEKFNGVVPQKMDDLLTLPGVGRKTANCLRSNILGLPGIVVDTHFSRVVERVWALGTRDPLKVEDFVCKNLPSDRWSRFSMTVNLHGRRVCHPAKPQCNNCPLSQYCKTADKTY